MKTVRFLSVFLIVIFCINFQNIHIVFADDEKGTTYYISNDGVDTNSGTSPEKPVSFDFANKYAFQSNDTILFKSGECFYGTLAPIVDSGEGTFTISSYGKGKKPEIKTVQITNDEWHNENNGFYSFDLKEADNHLGVGGFASNICRIETVNQKRIGSLCYSITDCINEFDFYIDDNCVYIRTDTEPTKEFGALQFVLEENGIELSSNFKIENLKISNCGRYGISFGNTIPKNVSITNCIIENVGNDTTEDEFRKGGGILIYDGCMGTKIKKNIISNCYGSAIRLFGHGVRYWNELEIKNNIFSKNAQSLAIDAGSNDADIGLDKLYFMNNICYEQGEPSEYDYLFTEINQNSDIIISNFGGQLFDIYIKGNTFINSSKDWNYLSCVYDDRFSQITSGQNHFYLKKESKEIIKFSQYYLGDEKFSHTLASIQETFDIERGSDEKKLDDQALKNISKIINSNNYSRIVDTTENNFVYEKETEIENPITFKDFVAQFDKSVIFTFCSFVILLIALSIYKIILKRRKV